MEAAVRAEIGSARPDRCNKQIRALYGGKQVFLRRTERGATRTGSHYPPSEAPRSRLKPRHSPLHVVENRWVDTPAVRITACQRVKATVVAANRNPVWPARPSHAAKYFVSVVAGDGFPSECLPDPAVIHSFVGGTVLATLADANARSLRQRRSGAAIATTVGFLSTVALTLINRVFL